MTAQANRESGTPEPRPSRGSSSFSGFFPPLPASVSGRLNCELSQSPTPTDPNRRLRSRSQPDALYTRLNIGSCMWRVGTISIPASRMS